MTKGTLLLDRNTHQSYRYELPFDEDNCFVSDQSGNFHLISLRAITPDWDRIIIFKIKLLITRFTKWIL